MIFSGIVLAFLLGAIVGMLVVDYFYTSLGVEDDNR